MEIDINIAEAMRYMGYKEGMDAQNIIEDIEECKKVLLDTVKPAYTYKIFDIEIADNIKILGTNARFEGKDIKEHLKGCKKVVLLCATLGLFADKLINRLQYRDMAKAVITDALASAGIEAVCNKAEEDILKKISPLNMTFRFSPGYGDFPLSTQESFIKVTNSEKLIGLTLYNGMLIPTKSVTAVIGLCEEKPPAPKRGCAVCNLKDSCQYRRKGLHCEK